MPNWATDETEARIGSFIEHQRYRAREVNHTLAELKPPNEGNPFAPAIG
jgi:hypothetical protein